jgi:hypothetical protein
MKNTEKMERFCKKNGLNNLMNEDGNWYCEDNTTTYQLTVHANIIVINYIGTK